MASLKFYELEAKGNRVPIARLVAGNRPEAEVIYS